MPPPDPISNGPIIFCFFLVYYFLFANQSFWNGNNFAGENKATDDSDLLQSIREALREREGKEAVDGTQRSAEEETTPTASPEESRNCREKTARDNPEPDQHVRLKN